MLIAIHQPNWLPWLGFFHKIARADTFVFLDGAQFSKGSYTNRVRILHNGEPRWLTQPIQQRFGQAISEIEFSDQNWVDQNISTLSNAYKHEPAFGQVFPAISSLMEDLPRDRLAASNRKLIEALCDRLGITAHFVSDSELGAENENGDDRLISLVRACARVGARYLSGVGGRDYQDETKFAAAGIEVEYTDFAHPVYDQGIKPFVPGLSVVDCLFRFGWQETARLIVGDQKLVS